MLSGQGLEGKMITFKDGQIRRRRARLVLVGAILVAGAVGFYGPELAPARASVARHSPSDRNKANPSAIAPDTAELVGRASVVMVTPPNSGTRVRSTNRSAEAALSAKTRVDEITAVAPAQQKHYRTSFPPRGRRDARSWNGTNMAASLATALGPTARVFRSGW